MARKQKRPLHPLRVVEAVQDWEEAASLFYAKVDALGTILADGAAVAIGKDLLTAAEAFRAAFWPEVSIP
jgi:hypothetical protein